MTRILIVDDEPLVCRGLRSILADAGDLEVRAEAADGAAALEQATRHRFDVVIMDVRMPRMDGVEATRRLLAGSSVAPAVLMLTTFDLDRHVFAALKAGARGFLLKSAAPEQLVDAVRIIAAGGALLAPSVTGRLIERFARLALPDVDGDRAVAGLSAREREVLLLMATGLSNREIARRLFLGETTVKSHVAAVLAKLGLRDRVQAVIFAYEHGLAGSTAASLEILPTADHDPPHG